MVHHGIRELAYSPPPREKVILNVGAIQKRKNIARLVEAFETVEPAGGWCWPVPPATARRRFWRASSEPGARPDYGAGLRLTGRTGPVVRRAMIFAFPSLDEGFGMPVLEAMAAGTPVLTSNRSALPEVAGDAAILVDPEDTEALGQALRDLTATRN